MKVRVLTVAVTLLALVGCSSGGGGGGSTEPEGNTTSSDGSTGLPPGGTSTGADGSSDGSTGLDGSSDGSSTGLDGSSGGSDGLDGSSDGTSGDIADLISNGRNFDSITSQWNCAASDFSYAVAFFDDGTGAFAQGDSAGTVDRWSVSGSNLSWSLAGGSQTLEYRGISFQGTDSFTSDFLIDGQNTGVQRCDRTAIGGGGGGGGGGSTDSIAQAISNGPNFDQIDSQWNCLVDGSVQYAVAFFDDGTGAFAQGDATGAVDSWSVSGTTVTWTLGGGVQTLVYTNTTFSGQDRFESGFTVDGSDQGPQVCDRLTFRANSVIGMGTPHSNVTGLVTNGGNAVYQ